MHLIVSLYKPNIGVLKTNGYIHRQVIYSLIAVTECMEH
jgi:hypothetical protein